MQSAVQQQLRSFVKETTEKLLKTTDVVVVKQILGDFSSIINEGLIYE